MPGSGVPRDLLESERGEVVAETRGDSERSRDDGRCDGVTLATRWMTEHWAAMVEMAGRCPGRGAATAEDIAQEALWAAYERRNRLVDATGERAWLLAFVRNKTRDARKRRGRRGQRLPEEYADSKGDAAPLECDNARRDSILEAAARLPDRQEEIVHLALAGCSDDEIAASTGLKKGTLWVYQHRAVRKLKQILVQ